MKNYIKTIPNEAYKATMWHNVEDANAKNGVAFRSGGKLVAQKLRVDTIPHAMIESWAELKALIDTCASQIEKTKGSGAHIISGTTLNGFRELASIQTVTGITLDIDTPSDKSTTNDLGGLRQWVESTGLTYILTTRANKAHLHIPFVTIDLSAPGKTKQYQGMAAMFLSFVNKQLEGIVECDLAMKTPSQVTYIYRERTDKNGAPQTVTVYSNGYEDDLRAFDLIQWFNEVGCKQHITATPKTYTNKKAQLSETGSSVSRAIANMRPGSHQDDLYAIYQGEWYPESGTRQRFFLGALTALTSANQEEGLNIEEFAQMLTKASEDNQDSDERNYNMFYTMIENQLSFVTTEVANSKYNVNKRYAKQKTEETNMTNIDQKLTRDNTGKPVNSPRNVEIVCAYAPELQDLFRLDTFANVIRENKDKARPWSSKNNNTDSINLELEDMEAAQWATETYGVEMQSSYWLAGLTKMAHRSTVDILEEYLDTLKWDGTNRIDTWLTDWLGVEDTELTRAYGARWLISGIARGYQLNTKKSRGYNQSNQADCVLTFVGSQGLGKTQTFRALGAPLAGYDWYLGDIQDVEKSGKEMLPGHWIIELQELAAVHAKEVEKVKQFLSMTSDTYRPAYGRTVQKFDRRCIFGGSTNNVKSLKDTTGNRRWWTVEATKQINIEDFKKIVNQLWAEAKERYLSGNVWHLDTTSLQQAHDLHLKAFEMESEYADRAYEFAVDKMSMLDMIDALDAKGKKQSMNQALAGMGWTYKYTKVDSKTERRWRAPTDWVPTERAIQLQNIRERAINISVV